MSRLEFILRAEDIEEEYLKPVGKINPNIYYLNLMSSIASCELKPEPYEEGKQALVLLKQSEKVKIGKRIFLVLLLCNPHPTKKKEKPSGLVFEDLSFLQVKEILLYDIYSEELFCYEYSYHYGIWDYSDEKEIYRIRHDREVIIRNPPRKKVEHLHVYYNDPHFDSAFMNLGDILHFLCINWDQKVNRLFIKELAM